MSTVRAVERKAVSNACAVAGSSAFHDWPRRSCHSGKKEEGAAVLVDIRVFSEKLPLKKPEHRCLKKEGTRTHAMQADEDWDALLPMPPAAAPGIAAHHGVDAAWPFPALAPPGDFAAFDSPAAMEQDQEGETRGSTGAVLGDALAAGLELDDAALAAAAVDDDDMPIPAQIHVDRQGKVGVCKNVAFCSQAGWKEGCVGGVGEFRGGSDKHNTRYRYECLSCNSWWSQIRPDRLQPGQDPEIRPVVFNEKRRAYRCSKCRLFCVPAKAAAAGEMRYCTCPRSEKTKRHK
eukprot:7385196-Prymnesium_polylepis.1